MTRSELVEAMARANDREEAAQMGGPSPWHADGPDFNTFRADRMAAMGEALFALEAAIPGLSGVLEGTHVVVPAEPTEAMIAAGGEAFFDAAVGHISGDMQNVNRPFQRYYRAMIAAAEGK